MEKSSHTDVPNLLLPKEKWT